MTPDEFRALALELPESVEGQHMDHPDFRVGGRIFATLWPGERRGVVMLTTEDQGIFTTSNPDTFVPVPGGWGRKGATSVILDHAEGNARAECTIQRLEKARAQFHQGPLILNSSPHSIMRDHELCMKN